MYIFFILYRVGHTVSCACVLPSHRPLCGSATSLLDTDKQLSCSRRIALMSQTFVFLCTRTFQQSWQTQFGSWCYCLVWMLWTTPVAQSSLCSNCCPVTAKHVLITPFFPASHWWRGGGGEIIQSLIACCHCWESASGTQTFCSGLVSNM
jgi:hypothetical protein